MGVVFAIASALVTVLWSQSQMVAEFKYSDSASAEHRERLEQVDQKIDKRVTRLEDVEAQVKQQLTRIEVQQTHQQKMLKKADRKLDRLIERGN